MTATMKAKQVWLMIGAISIFLFVVSCDKPDLSSNGNDVSPAEKEAETGEWEKVIYECISKVETSDAVFYRRGKPVSGKAVAQEMRKSMRIILRVKSLPDPFGRNAGILLAAITTYEGYAMDGITGPPTPFEVAVNGKRMRLYDWLKQELGLGMLPGEEEGHEIFLPLYDAVVTPELLKRWEEYLGKCIAVTEQATNCWFRLNGKYFTAIEAAQIFKSNMARALEWLKYPQDITHPDEKDFYRAFGVLIKLTLRPPPKREEFSDPKEYSRESHLWATSHFNWVECNGVKVDVIDWLKRNAGEPPPMPKLEKRGKGGG
jgi:hypothetical protein